MNKQIIIPISLVLAIPLAVFGYLEYSKYLHANNTFISPNILYITQPVTIFSGVIEKINGSTITVSQAMYLSSPLVVPATNASSPPPSPIANTISYNITVNDQTLITQISPYVNYLFKANTLSNYQTLSLSDLSVGQNVTINSKVDLRTLKSNTFEAVSINLPAIFNTLGGTITQINGTGLIVKGLSPSNQLSTTNNSLSSPPTEQEYIIKITDNTEISRLNPGTPPRPEKLNLSNLKIGMHVDIYTNSDIGHGTEFEAIRIEPTAPLTTPPTSL